MTTFSVSTTSRYLWVNAASDFKSDHPWKSAHPLPGYARCMGAHVEALLISVGSSQSLPGTCVALRALFLL